MIGPDISRSTCGRASEFAPALQSRSACPVNIALSGGSFGGYNTSGGNGNWVTTVTGKPWEFHSEWFLSLRPSSNQNIRKIHKIKYLKFPWQNKKTCVTWNRKKQHTNNKSEEQLSHPKTASEPHICLLFSSPRHVQQGIHIGLHRIHQSSMPSHRISRD